MSHDAASQLTFDMSCLFTTVRNNSGQQRRFGFLPPHGRQLAADEEFTMFGNITEVMVAQQRVTSKRRIDALMRAIDAGDLVITETPRPILQDQDTAAIKMLELRNGTLSAEDPCWLTSAS
jgi:hypothetical protein